MRTIKTIWTLTKFGVCAVFGIAFAYSFGQQIGGML